MSFKRFLLLQNGLDHPGGHWLPETKSLRHAVLKEGLEWACFANSRLSQSLALELDARPAIPFLHGNILAGNDPQTRLASFMMGAETLPAILHRHYPGSPSPNDLLHVGWTTDLEMIGVARWLESIPPASRPAVSFYFHRLPGYWNVDPSTMAVSGDFHRWRYAVARLKRTRVRMSFSSVDHMLSRILSRLLSIPAICIPLVQGDVRAGSSRDSNPGFDLGIFGGSRPEQGAKQLPGILEELRKRHPRLKTVIQVLSREHEHFLTPRIHPAWNGTHVSLLVGHLEKQAQLDRMAACKLLLLPYDPRVYCLTMSAIFTDAVRLGLPVVAPALTSMGRTILSGAAAGTVYHGNDDASVADAVMKSLHDLENLSARARGLSQGFKDRHSAIHFLKELCTALSQEGWRT